MQYRVGQEVNGIGGGAVNGYILRIIPDEPGAVDGPGLLDIGPHPPAESMAAPPPVVEDGITEVQTSNIAKVRTKEERLFS